MNADNITDVRSSTFVKGTTIDKLPPTRDSLSLYLHIKRSHSPALVFLGCFLFYALVELNGNFLLRDTDMHSAYVATATWLAVRHTPVLYQNG